MTIIIPAYGFDEDGNEEIHNLLIFIKDIEMCEEIDNNTVIILKSEYRITAKIRLSELQKKIHKADASNLIRLN